MGRGLNRLKAAPFLFALSLAMPLAAQAVDYTVSSYLGAGATICPTTPTIRTSIGVTNSSIYSLTSDGSGNLYYVDYGLGNICKVDTNGYVSRIAGTGTNAFGSDNVLGTSTSVYNPLQIAADAAGNVYVAEYTNGGSVRKIAPNGIITSIYNSSHGTSYAGDGSLAVNATGGSIASVAVSQSGNIYFWDRTFNKIRKISTNGNVSFFAGAGLGTNTGDGGLATNANIGSGLAIATDSNENVYIGGNESCIRKIDATTGIISTLAGTCGTAGSSGDGGAATSALLGTIRSLIVGSNNVLYISDQNKYVVRTVDLNTGIIQTLAGIGGSYGYTDGPTSTALFNGVYGVAFDQNSNMYVADRINNRIRMVAGAGPAGRPTAPSLSVSGTASYRTNITISASGGTSGKLTFFANGKRISGCISRTYTTSMTCTWKPTSRGLATIYVQINNGTYTSQSAQLTINVINRTLPR